MLTISRADSQEMSPLKKVLDALQIPSLNNAELSLYGKKQFWTNKGKHQRAIKQYFHPHMDDYFSLLRPVFLHQLESAEALNRFSFLQTRDGALGLLWFFYRNPKPPQSAPHCATLLVDYRLSAVIPPSWDQQVAYYDFAPSASPLEKKRIYLSFNFLDSKQCTPEYAERVIRALPPLPITCLPFHNLKNKSKGLQNSAPIHQSLDLFQAISHLTLKKTNQPLIFASASELESTDLRDAIFVDLNENLFYYSDSFLRHFMLSRGAQEWKSEPLSPNPIPHAKVPLSPYHEAWLFGQPPCSLDKRKHNENLFNSFMQDPLICKELQKFNTKKSFKKGLKFTPLSLEAFAYDILKR